MLNFRHLYYFWVVTKEGGFARAAERLDMAVQTISPQVRDLEKALGHQLLKPAGRGLPLTEAGEPALPRAEEVSQHRRGLPAAPTPAPGFLMRPPPSVVQAPAASVAQLSQADIDSAVAKAVQAVEARQQKQMTVALSEIEKRHTMETQMMAVGFRENLDLVRKQLNMVYVSNARLTAGGTD